MEYSYKPTVQNESEIMNKIYDEEFISSINSLSSSIKEYYNQTKISINNFKIGTDSINNQIIYSKTILTEALRTQTNAMKYSIVHSQNEISMKEKILSINERMERLTEMKSNIDNDIKNFEALTYNFYDKAKTLFKKLKNIRDKNIDKISNNRHISYFNSPIESKFKSTNISNHHSLNTSTNIDIKKDELLIKRNEQLVSENAVIKYQYSKLLEEFEQLKVNLNKEKKDNININNNNDNNNDNNNTINDNDNINVGDTHYFRNKQFDTVVSNDNSNSKKNKIVMGIKNKININHGILKSLQKNNNFITLQINPKRRNYSASQSNSLNKHKKITTEYNTLKKNISLKDHYNITQSNSKTKNTYSNPMTNCVTTENSLNSTLNKPKNISLISIIKKDSLGRNNILLNNYMKKSMSIGKKPTNKIKPEINKNRNNSNFLLTTNNSNNNSQSKNNSVNMLTVSIQSNQSIEQCNTINNSFSNNNILNTNLPSLVLAFLDQMDQLQSAISQRINKDNVRDMKLNFGKKKKELIKICDNLIKNMSYNNCRNTCLTTTNNSLNNSPRISNKIPFKSQNIGNIKQDKISKDNNSQDTSIMTVNNTQNNIEDKIKELEKLIDEYKKEIESKNDDIKKIKSEIELKEEKIKNEKLISKLCEEKLNQEKEANKKKEDEIINLNNKIEKLENINKQYIDKINEIEKQNKKFIDNEKIYETNNNNLNNEILSLKQQIQKNKNDFNEQNNNNKNIINKKNEEIKQLELKIKDNNNNIITMSNNNQLAIKEKTDKINELLAIIKDMKNNKIDEKTNINNKELEKLKEELNSYQTKATDFKNENKILKNKIAEIKVEYISKKDEELETIKKDLIKLNDETGIKLNTLLYNNEKEKSQTEKNIEYNINKELKLHNNQIDLCDVIDKIKLYSDELSIINNELETKVTLASEPAEDIANDIIKLKKENEKLKVIILSIQGKDFLSSRNDKLKNKINIDNNDKSINNLIEHNSKFLDDELSSLSGIFNDDNKKDEFNIYTNDKKDNAIK